MKKIIIISIFFISLYPAHAQDNLRQIYQQQNRITQSGMYVLGGWAIANILTNSSLLLFGNPEGQIRHFYEMNIYWNLVNVSLAGISQIQLRKVEMDDIQFSTIIDRQKRFEKIFLFNTGLDIAYIVGGLYLRELGKNEINNQDLFTGFGNAVILQGSFLFIFDLAMYIIHVRHAATWMPLFNHLRLGYNQVGVMFKI